MKSLILLMFTSVMVLTEVQAQSAFRTRASGNWNDSATWEKWDGNAWHSPLSSTDYPGLFDSVYIQFLHSVTLTQDHSCHHLNLNNGLGARLMLNDHFLSVGGRLALFLGLANFPVTHTNLNVGASINNGPNNLGLIRIQGGSRTLMRASEWSPDIIGLNLEVLLLNKSDVVTAETSLKVGRLAVVQGKLEVLGDLYTDNGTGGGDILVDVAAALHVTNLLQHTGTGGSADSITVAGVLTLGPGANQGLSANTLRVLAGASLEMKNQVPYTFNVLHYTLAQGSRLIYSGNILGQPTGNEFPATGVSTLVVNTNGSINLGNSKAVSDSLIMISGNINIGAGDSLRLGINANAVLQHTSGTIIGKLNRHITILSLGVTLFPVGSAAHYRPVVIDFLGVPLSSGNISVAHADISGGADIAPFNDGGFLVNRRSNMHWDVGINSGLLASNIILRADVRGQDGITDSSQLRLIGTPDNGLNFGLLGGLSLPLVGTLGAIGGLNLDSNNFSIYLGGNLTTNPLPVTFSSLKGRFVNNASEISWQTASEINNDYFEVQRSADGKQFIKIGTVKATGSKSTVTDYVYIDRSPVSGANFYRLAQYDLDRTVDYSDVIRVNATSDETVKSLLVGPSPVDDELKVVLDHNAYTRVQVVDMLGQTRIVKELNAEVIDFSLDMTVLKHGIYFVQFMQGDKPVEVKRVYKL